MGTVVHVDFTAKSSDPKVFSADVYTNDMRCERFDVPAACPKLAYRLVVSSPAFGSQYSGVRAIAIYANSKVQRNGNQLPLLVSNFKEPEQTPALNL